MSAPQPADAPESKAYATLAARLAIAGYGLHRLHDGSFLVHRWNFSRHLPDLHAVAKFLEAVA